MAPMADGIDVPKTTLPPPQPPGKARKTGGPHPAPAVHESPASESPGVDSPETGLSQEDPATVAELISNTTADTNGRVQLASNTASSTQTILPVMPVLGMPAIAIVLPGVSPMSAPETLPDREITVADDNTTADNREIFVTDTGANPTGDREIFTDGLMGWLAWARDIFVPTEPEEQRTVTPDEPPPFEDETADISGTDKWMQLMNGGGLGVESAPYEQVLADQRLAEREARGLGIADAVADGYFDALNGNSLSLDKEADWYLPPSFEMNTGGSNNQQPVSIGDITTNDDTTEQAQLSTQQYWKLYGNYAGRDEHLQPFVDNGELFPIDRNIMLRADLEALRRFNNDPNYFPEDASLEYIKLMKQYEGQYNDLPYEQLRAVGYYGRDGVIVNYAERAQRVPAPDNIGVQNLYYDTGLSYIEYRDALDKTASEHPLPSD